MKKFYIAYWENLHRKETVIEAKGKIQAEKIFKETHGKLTIIQLKEIAEA